jgi:uncharacterized damage-inducible protein DinB
MKRSEFIANRLREVLLNGYWIANTNYKDQLLSVTWQQAVNQIADLNTVAALTYHINYYLAGLLNVFNGGLLEIKDQYSFDLPPIKSETDWKKLLDEFLSNSEVFANEVEQMPDEKLDEVFVSEKYGTYQRNIEAVIEHSYYHLGQIVLIKKLILTVQN